MQAGSLVSTGTGISGTGSRNMRRLLRGLLAFVYLFFVASANAEPVSISSQADIENSVGIVEIIFTGKAESSSLSGELIVHRISDSSVVQRIKVEDVFHPVGNDAPLRIEFLDLNDDGFKDMIFWNSLTGSGGAAYAADVYLWISKLKRFVRSKTLSQSGEISKSKKKGCVEISSKCNSFIWSTEEYCFNQTTGRWKSTRTDQGCR